jgi:hypothetical protein
MNTNPLTAELLRSLFNYDPRSGVITYAANRGPRLAGQPAGSTQRGLPCIYVAGKHHRACLIAWILAYGVDPSPKYVIHTDRDPFNLSISNLELSDFQIAYRSPRGKQRRPPSWQRKEIKFFRDRSEWRLKYEGVVYGFYPSRAEAIAARMAIARSESYA